MIESPFLLLVPGVLAAPLSAISVVEVFALAFVERLPSWPEQGERGIRWFTLDEAVRAVDEPDLGELIRALPQYI